MRGADLFTLRKCRGKTEHVAVCELWSHQLGWELKLVINGELQRTHVCRSEQELARHTAADVWKDALLKSTWAHDAQG